MLTFTPLLRMAMRGQNFTQATNTYRVHLALSTFEKKSDVSGKERSFRWSRLFVPSLVSVRGDFLACHCRSIVWVEHSSWRDPLSLAKQLSVDKKVISVSTPIVVSHFRHWSRFYLCLKKSWIVENISQTTPGSKHGHFSRESSF